MAGTRGLRKVVPPLSAAHALMVVSGLLAFVLVLLVLRDGDRVMTVAVAATDLAPGDPLEVSSVRLVEMPAAVGVVRGLVGADVVASDGEWHLTTAVPRGALLRKGDLAETRGPAPRVMSVPVDGAVTDWIEPGVLVDLVVVAEGAATVVAAGLPVVAVDGDDGLGRGRASLLVEIARGQELDIAVALAGGDVHIVRAADG